MYTNQHPIRTDEWLLAARDFVSEPKSVALARRWARQAYASEGALPDVCDVCELLVSEVVTNSVLHAGGDKVTVRIYGPSLRVEVCDESYRLPQRRVADESATGGRGLELLSLLAPGHEVLLGHAGKTVCFRPGAE